MMATVLELSLRPWQIIIIINCNYNKPCAIINGVTKSFYLDFSLYVKIKLITFRKTKLDHTF